MLLFTILVNARTGFVVFAIAVILKIFMGNHKNSTIIKIILFTPIIYFSGKYILPIILNVGSSHSNTTVSWVSRALFGLHSFIFDFKGAESITNATFLSHFDVMPTNIFTLLFGSGHIIYGTRDILGLATDVGYINLIWAYGVFGFTVLSITFIKVFIKSKNMSDRIDYKFIAIFNLLSYYIVQFKANLIGYNPGTFITYLITFGLIYYGYKSLNDEDYSKILIK